MTEYVPANLARIEADLAPELESTLAERKLANNRDSYPTSDWLHFEEHQRRFRVIRDHLLKVPLVHVTSHDFDTHTDILPNADRSAGGHTTDFDRSLGLHKYVFFRWGVPDTLPNGMLLYGDTLLLIDARLLIERGTIASPFDIGEIAYIDDAPYQQLAAGDRIEFDRKGLDKLVTGNDWIEIVARRGLDLFQSGKGCCPVPATATDFGEIKYLGPVPSSRIIDKIPAVDLSRHYAHLASLGVFVEGYGDEAKARTFWDGLLTAST